MKYCIKCVAKLQDDALYCSFCGAKQGDLKKSPHIEYTPNEPAAGLKTAISGVQSFNGEQNAEVTVSKENEFSYDLTDDNEGVLIKGLKVLDNVVNVIIPDKIEDMDVKEIAYGTFSGHNKLKFVHLPAMLTVIGVKMFADCANLQKVELPPTLTKILERAFMGATKLQSITVPAGVAFIEPYTFAGCTALTDVTLSSITKILEGAFSGCTAIENIKLPYALNTVSQKAFSDCSNLKEIEFTKSIRFIEAHAFDNCYSLREVTFGEGCRKVEWGSMYTGDVFTGCTNLSLKSKARIRKLGYKGKF